MDLESTVPAPASEIIVGCNQKIFRVVQFNYRIEIAAFGINDNFNTLSRLRLKEIWIPLPGLRYGAVLLRRGWNFIFITDNDVLGIINTSALQAHKESAGRLVARDLVIPPCEKSKKSGLAQADFY